MRTENTNIIFRGDCSEVLKKKELFPDNSVDLIITSPPYAQKRKNTYGGIHPDKYVEWFLPISLELKRVLKNNGSFILNIKEHPQNGERQTYVLELILAMKHQGWIWIEEYCWYKKNSFPGKWPNRFRDSWERCIHFTKQKKFKMNQDAVKVPIGDWAEKRFKSMSENDFVRHISGTNGSLGRNVSNWLNKKKVFPHNVLVFEEEHRLYGGNVIELPTECSNKNHSAVFPVELPSWFIRVFSNKNNVILDPFMGSGTTAVAALLHGRKYQGIELLRDHVLAAEENINEVIKTVYKKRAHKIKKRQK